MSDQPIFTNEEATNDPLEEQNEPVEQTNIVNKTTEETKTQPTEETKTQPIEETKEDITNKTSRLSEKKITCPKCDKTMNLRSYRYKHEKNCQGHLEQRPIKAQSKPRAKPKAVAIQPPINNNIVTNEEPAYIQQVKQQVRSPEPPPVIKTPQEIINENFMLIQQQYINQRRGKANNLVQSMFSGGLRNKRR